MCTTTTQRHCCRQERSCIPFPGMPTRQQKSLTLIRMPRSPGDSEPLMKWDRRGSVGTTCPNKTSKKRLKRAKRCSRCSAAYEDESDICSCSCGICRSNCCKRSDQILPRSGRESHIQRMEGEP